jgi:hypothetical protein
MLQMAQTFEKPALIAPCGRGSEASLHHGGSDLSSVFCNQEALWTGAHF